METLKRSRGVLWAALFVGAVIFPLSIHAQQTDNPRDVLPEGATGIASHFPGDVGIEEDERIIFVERFDEDSIDALAARWESVDHRDLMSFSDDVPSGSGDEASLLMTHTGGGPDNISLYRRLLSEEGEHAQAGYERVFARFYVKFDPDCVPIHHMGTALGGFNPTTRWPQGGAGELPEGDKRFTSGLEPYGRSWQWGFYTYWHEMHVHGDGNYWGTPFLSGVDGPEVERGKWICIEVMMQMNEVGESNGEQAFWINGELWEVDGQIVSHHGPGFPRGRWTGGWWSPDAESDRTFEGFDWRTTRELAVNYLWTYLYITRSPEGHVSKVWFDQIVVAREYIGPLEPVAE